MKHKQSVLLKVVLVLLTTINAFAQYNDGTDSYVFLPDQSNVVQTGGFAGVHETYPIQGQFHLVVDANADVASFAAADANLLNPTGFLPTESLGELFNITNLEGTVVGDTLIEFRGKTADDTNTNISLKLTFSADIVQLTGQTIPPPNTADFFIFNIDAVAQRKYGGGTGDPNNPCLIYTAEHLNELGVEPNDYDKHFKLMADIDLSQYLYDSAVIAPDANDVGWRFDGTPFNGVFDGNQHVISHLTMREGSYLALFGQLDSEAKIYNLGLEAVDVNGSTRIASLAARNYGYIAGSYSTGIVRGGDRVGGLVGVNGPIGRIVTSYSNVAVEGSGDTGGLVGRNYGSINRSYSIGVVRGENLVGGLVGSGRENSSVTSSFWDIETSDQATSPSGIGLTTDEMQTSTTFLNAGWDFNNIWKIWDGYGYPRLQWEPGPNPPLVFVDINDPGFNGQISRYEITNAQYCDFLNAALASGDITVNGNEVEGTSGLNSGADYAGHLYYNSDGSGYSGYGATNGGAARIYYSAGVFNIDSSFGNHPVTYVSWYGAMAFANYYGYYLPTEDQWQAVADFDGTYTYGCGKTIDPGIANYRHSEHPDGTVSVGSFGLYGYGMSDMAGNVWEWTSSSLNSNRVFRGGSLGSLDSDCAVSIRGDGIPHAAYYDIGFRVCR
ncbi:formylglycine-generating enzyme family protein [Planctomycetota bacterium]